MKKFIAGFLVGALLFSFIGVFAYNIYENPYKIMVNGVEKQIQGYNVDDYSYFKLRDIADAVGGFDVDFQNDTIQVSKDGYSYEEINTIKQSKKPFSDKYDWDYLSENEVYYDLDGDNNLDKIKVNSYPSVEATGDEMLQGYGRFELIINDIPYYLGDIRHGFYREVIISDIDQTDNYIDIAMIAWYKGKWATIYRFNGEGLLGLSNESASNENFFNSTKTFMYDVDSPECDLTMRVNDSLTEGVGFSLICAGEIHNFVKVSDTAYKEIE